MHAALAKAAENRSDVEGISYEKAYKKEERDEIATAKRDAINPVKDLDKIKRWFEGTH